MNEDDRATAPQTATPDEGFEGPETLLICAAWEPELTRFRALAAARLAGDTVRVAPVGIGAVDAGIGVTRCITREAPAGVVLLGTCGAAVGSGLSVHDVVVAASVRMVDVAVLDAKAKPPLHGGDAVLLDTPLADAMVGAGAKSVRIANTLSVTIDDGLAERLAAAGEVEHLEAYGVARACMTANVPCAIVLGVANMVGKDGSRDWMTNQDGASSRAAEVVCDAIVAMQRDGRLRMSTTARSPERS